jgi:diguanylate cyclase (GGDEF)-like protein
VTDRTPPCDPVALLDTLKGYPFLHPYSLAVYSLELGIIASRGTPPPLCGVPDRNRLCGNGALCPLHQAAREAIELAVPAICRCHLSIQGFAVRFRDPGGSSFCLIGWGVRGESINLAYLEKVAQRFGADPFALLEQWGDLSECNPEEVKSIANQVHRLLPSLQGQNLQTRLLEKTEGQLSTVVDLAGQIERAGSAAEIFAVLSESVGICFDVPLIAVALPDRELQAFTLHGTWGLPPDLGTIPFIQLEPTHGGERFITLPQELPELFAGSNADRASCFPLVAEEELFGLLVLYGVELHQRDALQIELLGSITAARLRRLQNGPHPLFDNALPGMLTAITDAMARAVGRKELYQLILESAAKLLNARSGSLMLFDDARIYLRIEAALGLNAQLSRNMRIKVGDGIAGKVAGSGTPIVVNDIENDSRVAATNRPRFKTKSFLSIPMKLGGKIIGVLNLSDKANADPFTGQDLQLVTVLVAQAGILIERNELQERTQTLERLSAADTLTGLYNRSFLGRRLDEELNRSSRQGLSFSLLLVELDYFGLYAELCGLSFANDALQKAAALLCACARQMDVVSRYGEAVFCILLPGTAKQAALTVARRIRTAIEREPFPCEENLPAEKITTTIGIAAFPDDAGTSPDLLAALETALYQAKADGRNRICAAQPEAAATAPRAQ